MLKFNKMFWLAVSDWDGGEMFEAKLWGRGQTDNISSTCRSKSLLINAFMWLINSDVHTDRHPINLWMKYKIEKVLMDDFKPEQNERQILRQHVLYNK